MLRGRGAHSAGVDRPEGRARVGAVRGEGGRAAGAGAGRVQGAGAGPRLRHLGADGVGRAAVGAHHGAVPHRAAAPAQRQRGRARARRDLLPRHLAAARRPEVLL